MCFIFINSSYYMIRFTLKQVFIWRPVLTVGEQKPINVQCKDGCWECSVSASLFKTFTFPSSPHLFLSCLYRCATMKPHAPVTLPGQGQTVVCLTRLKSLRPLRKKDPRVGFHFFQPLTSDRIDKTHTFICTHLI